MKLRIRENILRFRLGKTEVERFQIDGFIKSEIRLGPAPANALIYELRLADLDQPELSFLAGKLTCSLPHEEVAIWFNSEQVGIYHTLQIDNNETVELILEKDFKCLVERSNEDDDGYPHPQLKASEK